MKVPTSHGVYRGGRKEGKFIDCLRPHGFVELTDFCTENIMDNMVISE